MPVSLVGPPEGVRGDRVDAALLARRARIALRALSLSRAELSLALVDDAQIRALNRDYRGKDRPTDVLSFSLMEGEDQAHRGGMLGDVVISVETAAAQAGARHRALDEEVARLMIHGLLHLIGHDHEQDEEARLMQREERRLWRSLRP